jgi:hypothetical protein
MRQILYDYQLNATTWVYLASLLMISIYFKFNRLWSVRNLDLLGLVALAPGLLLVDHGGSLQERLGYVWLFVMGGLFLLRLLSDPLLTRRPLLEPNMSTGGMTFLAVSLLVFLMVNVATAKLTEGDLDGARRLDQLISRSETPPDQSSLAAHGPGYPLLHLLPGLSQRALVEADAQVSEKEADYMVHAATARTMAILSHLLVVFGITLIGWRHFDNLRTGIAAATLYLMLPYTAQMTGRVEHVLPAALLVWAVLAYRRPLLSGILIGLAIGAVYYPVFLLPLWVGFYWHRGLLRFATGVVVMLTLLVASLAFTSSDFESFAAQARQMLGWTSLTVENAVGFWSFNPPAYRLPVLAGFAVLCGSFALWPAQKNLGTLMSCSAAVMLGTQFWHANEGGLYVAWYLPLLLLTIFRPNLEDRVAVAALGEGWFKIRPLPYRVKAA